MQALVNPVHAASPPRPVRPWWLSATSLALVLAVVRLGASVFADYPAVAGMFDDDAFYYFGIARHLAAGDGSTFNGLEATNGYHPLWLLVLVPVFVVAKGKAALVGVTLVSSVLFVLSARMIDRIGMLTGRPVRVACCALPLLVVGTVGPSFWFSGMETGLLLFGLLWLAVVYVRTEGFAAPWFGTTHACGVGALMAVVVLARLDAVFTMAVLGALAVIAWRAAGLRWVRLGLIAAGIPAVVLGGYVVVNLALFGTTIPVSGQAKALGGAAVHTEAIGQFLTAPVVFGRPSALGAIAVAVVVGALFTRVSGALGLAARFAAVVLVGGLVSVAYYVVTSSWHLWPWYFSAAPVAVALAGPALLQRWAGRALGRSVLVASTVLVLGAATVTVVREVRGGADRAAYVMAAPRVAAEIDALVPRGAPVAMGDRGGSVGYHLTRPLVQLEGLVGSTRYLDALADGTVPRLLAEQGVAFYARGDSDPGQPDPDHPGCSRFTEPQQGDGVKFTITVCAADLLIAEPLSDGTSYRVWRYLRQLNS